MSNLVNKKPRVNKLTAPPPPKPHNQQNSIKTLEDLARMFPNDSELGAAVRKYLNK